ncbi:MAG TPA: HTH domain-containing protein [Candidatus Dormibacteraeota bacterium]
MNKARRFARLLSILAAVIREPGLSPARLAARAGVSERTLRRDLARLRGLGYTVTWSHGYEVQERFGFEGGGGARSLAAVYEQQARLLRSELPGLAGQVEAEVEAEAPAAVATLFAEAIARQLRSRR